MHWSIIALALAAVAASAPCAAAPRKVILDTDIGDDVDDAYALALVCADPNVRLLGVTTAFGDTARRAELAARLLSVLGKPEVPVRAGRAGGHPIGRQYEWARGFRSRALADEEAVAFIKRQVDRAPGEVTLVAVGALTNLGDLVTRHPRSARKIREIVIMGGAVHVGYSNKPPVEPEWNIRCDPAAARAVYSSGVPLTMAGLEATTMLQLDVERQKRLFAQGGRATDALAALTVLWGNGVPTLFDPMAVAWALGHRFCQTERLRVEVEESGLTRIVEGEPNVTVLIEPRKDAFLDWYVQALAPLSASRR
ncbi:MAG: nucleoside hydrolase [Chthonomonadales bacterium]|nr:nucleoside hydrolase [Chthonomonadales bacterium]